MGWEDYSELALQLTALLLRWGETAVPLSTLENETLLTF